MKKLLDEIGIDGRRLNLFNVPVNDQAVVDHIIDRPSPNWMIWDQTRPNIIKAGEIA